MALSEPASPASPNSGKQGKGRISFRKSVSFSSVTSAKRHDDICDIPKNIEITEKNIALLEVKASMKPPRQAFAFHAPHAEPHVGMSAQYCRQRAFWIVSSAWFDALIGLVIIISSLSIGVEMEMAGKVPGRVWKVFEAAFLGIFVCEMLVKLYVFRRSYFDSRWNVFDFILVLSGILAAGLDAVAMGASAVRSIQLLRTARLLRLIRMVRLSTQFQSLWLIVNGLVSCMSTVFSTLVLISGLTYFFSIIVIELIAIDETIGEASWSKDENVGARFGSILSSMVSLCAFFALDEISGKGWELMKVNPICALFLLSFMLIVSIVLLNLITAVIVEMSLKAAAHDDEHRRTVQQAEWKAHCAELEEIFSSLVAEDDPCEPVGKITTDRISSDGSFSNIIQQLSMGRPRSQEKDEPNNHVSQHTLTLEKLQELAEDNDSVLERLNLLFGEPEDTKQGLHRLMEFWPVLDVNGDGHVTISEFTHGLAKLHDVINNRGGELMLWLRLLNEMTQAAGERSRLTQQQKEAMALQRERLSIDKQISQRMEQLASDVDRIKTDVDRIAKTQAASQSQLDQLVGSKLTL